MLWFADLRLRRPEMMRRGICREFGIDTLRSPHVHLRKDLVNFSLRLALGASSRLKDASTSYLSRNSWRLTPTTVTLPDFSQRAPIAPYILGMEAEFQASSMRFSQQKLFPLLPGILSACLTRKLLECVFFHPVYTPYCRITLI